MQDDSMYRQRAAKLGADVDEMIVRLIRRGEGFIDMRKIWGILSLDKCYAPAKINAACRRALEMDSLSYRMVKHLLEIEEVNRLDEAGQPRMEDPQPGLSVLNQKQHKHVRPLSVYQEQLSLFKH